MTRVPDVMDVPLNTITKELVRGGQEMAFRGVNQLKEKTAGRSFLLEVN